MDPDKISLKFHVKILTPWAKGVQDGKKCGVFVTGTLNLFFVTGQVSIKFGKNINRCALVNLNRRILSFPLGCDFAPKPPFLCLLTGLPVTSLQVMDYVSRLS